MLKFGRLLLDVNENGSERLRIVSDGPFTVYGLYEGERHKVLGPESTAHRMFSMVIPEICDQIEIVTAEETGYEFERVYLPPRHEPNSGIPHETALEERPMTLKDEMKLYLAQEIRRIRQLEENDDFETFEEAQDFEIPEDDVLSGYQVLAMQDDFPPPEDQPTASEASPVDQTTAPPTPETPEVSSTAEPAHSEDGHPS